MAITEARERELICNKDNLWIPSSDGDFATEKNGRLHDALPHILHRHFYGNILGNASYKAHFIIEIESDESMRVQTHPFSLASRKDGKTTDYPALRLYLTDLQKPGTAEQYASAVKKYADAANAERMLVHGIMKQPVPDVGWIITRR